MRKRVFSFAAALYFALALVPASVFALQFPDVTKTTEHYQAINFVSNDGIMVGDDAGRFRPAATVTRAEMAAILCRSLGFNGTTNKSSWPTFSDVAQNHWANDHIRRLAFLNVIGGYGNGKFGPSDPVTYEQALAMVVRAVGYTDDANKRGGYPDGYIDEAQSHGLLRDVNALKGQPLSRAEVAQIIYNGCMTQDLFVVDERELYPGVSKERFIRIVENYFEKELGLTDNGTSYLISEDIFFYGEGWHVESYVSAKPWKKYANFTFCPELDLMKLESFEFNVKPELRMSDYDY